MSNGIYSSAVNAAIELVRLTEDTHAANGGSVIEIAKQVAFEAGWTIVNHGQIGKQK